jgi:hypothetical protein
VKICVIFNTCVIVGLPCQNKIWFSYVEFSKYKVSW